MAGKNKEKSDGPKEMDTQKFQELQMMEQNLQNTLMQKQAFQMEISETNSALEEIKKADDDVFKIIGQMMIKSNKTKVLEELENKKKMLDLRMGSLEKQEKNLSEKLEELRKEFM